VAGGHPEAGIEKIDLQASYSAGGSDARRNDRREASASKYAPPDDSKNGEDFFT